MKAKISKGKEKYNFENIIIDGRNQVFKYQHTMKYLTNSKKVETGIYHGFLSLVLKLRKDNMSARIIVAWEGGNLVRRQQLLTYKNGRPEAKNSFEKKIRNLKDMLGMLGVEQKFAPGYEADDIAAIITKQNPEQKTLLVSEDRDWYQSMHKNTYVMHKNKIYSYEDVKRQEGFNPERFGLYVLLKGKKGNNVEGIPYFPTILAKEIVNNSSSLEKIFLYKTDDTKYKKWIDIIHESKNDLEEKYKIVKLRNDIKMENTKCHKRDHSALKKILTELEMFKVISLIKNIKRLKKLSK